MSVSNLFRSKVEDALRLALAAGVSEQALPEPFTNQRVVIVDQAPGAGAVLFDNLPADLKKIIGNRQVYVILLPELTASLP